MEIHNSLHADQVAEVVALAVAAAEADGVSPLGEQVWLHLRHGGDREARHVLIRRTGALVGYAHVDITDAVAGSSAELVVHPSARRQGLGHELVSAAVTLSPDDRLRLWAHGEHPAAASLAASLGFSRTRILWQFRRSLRTPLPVPGASSLPDGFRLRTFVVGQDEPAWVTLNNRVFAGHTEQGRWTERDIKIREAEPWFDPAGFLLVEHESTRELVGFHWTKVHGSTVLPLPDHEPHDHEEIGEVYVVGVDPAVHGRGLGVALTLAGLRYLRSRGIGQAMLYVDATNPAAVALYQKLGFLHWSTDIEFARR